MTESQQIISLLTDIRALLQRQAAPIVALEIEQLAKASIEDQKAASKATVARLRAKHKGAKK